jgi:hypothetical protein
MIWMMKLIAGCGELQRQFPSTEPSRAELAIFSGANLDHFNKINQCLQGLLYVEMGTSFVATNFQKRVAQQSVKLDPLISHITKAFIETTALASLQQLLDESVPAVSPTLQKVILANFAESCLSKN